MKVIGINGSPDVSIKKKPYKVVGANHFNYEIN